MYKYQLEKSRREMREAEKAGKKGGRSEKEKGRETQVTPSKRPFHLRRFRLCWQVVSEEDCGNSSNRLLHLSLSWPREREIERRSSWTVQKEKESETRGSSLFA